MGDSALTNFAEQIMANRRANMIAEAMDHSEYWRAQYQEMLDKYNKLVKEYNYTVSRRGAEADYLIEVLQNNVDNLNISKEEINEGLEIARNKAAEQYPPV